MASRCLIGGNFATCRQVNGTRKWCTFIRIMYECPLRVPQIRGIRWALKLHVCMWRAYVIGVETARMSIRNVSCNLVLRGAEIQADENRRGGRRKRDINFILRRRNRFIINRNNRRLDIIPRKYSSSHRPVFACRSMYGNFTATSPWKLDACGTIS